MRIQHCLLSILPRDCRRNILNILRRLIFIVLFSVPSFIHAQYSEEQVKAALVYHFCNYVSWPDGKIKETFEIGVFSQDSSLFTKLQSIAGKRNIHDKPIHISLINSLALLDTFHVLVVDREMSKKSKDLIERIKDRSILLITDQSPELLYVMINFTTDRKDNRISYEINSHNIESEQLTYSPDLLIKGGTVIDMKELYARTYEQLNQEGERLHNLQQQVEKLQTAQGISQSMVRSLLLQVDSLEEIMKSKEVQLKSLSEDIRSKESLLSNQGQILLNQKKRESDYQVKMQGYEKSIFNAQSLLDSINLHISQKEAIIDLQESMISEKDQLIYSQKKNMKLLALLIFALALAGFSLIWAYRARRRMNLRLEELVKIRTQELMESQEYYRNLFENSPVAVLEEDLSELYQYLKQSGIRSEADLEVQVFEDEESFRLAISKIRLISFNQATLSLFNARSKEFFRENVMETMHKPARNMLAEGMRAVWKNEVFFENETIFNTFGNGQKNIIVRWIVVPGHEHTYKRVLVTYSDITALKQYEHELQLHKNNLELLVRDAAGEVIILNAELVSSNEALISQKKQLELTLAQLQTTQSQLVQAEKMVSLGMLAAGIAHEINNPINFISAGTQLLESKINILIDFIKRLTAIADESGFGNLASFQHALERLNLEQTETSIAAIHEKISSGIDRTTSIIRSLSLYSRGDQETFAPYDLRDIIQKSLLLLNSKYKYHIKIEEEYTELPLIECIPVRVSQVYVNILSNAIDSIKDQGKIKIHAFLDAERNAIVTKIADTGEGIPDSILEHIFDPFFTTKEVGKGTGLGLYLVYQIVQQHNGQIFCESTPGEGTVFTIIWPLHLVSSN
jgi:signal transduction histidine kinase/PAS domain-containing protein